MLAEAAVRHILEARHADPHSGALAPWSEVIYEDNHRRAISAHHAGETVAPIVTTEAPVPKPWHISDYSFYQTNVERHADCAPKLATYLAAQRRALRTKELGLKRQFRSLYENWQRTLEARNSSRTSSVEPAGAPTHLSPRHATPADGGPSTSTTATPTTTLHLGTTTTVTRQKRRHTSGGGVFSSDAVRSEAELMEIIQSLEHEEMHNPDVRSSRTAAVIPNMILDPAERERFLYHNTNGLVRDPISYYCLKAPLAETSAGPWTHTESDVFIRKYLTYPKRFGKIARFVGSKTVTQCVLFYYRTKKHFHFKFLLTSPGRSEFRQARRLGLSASQAAFVTGRAVQSGKRLREFLAAGPLVELVDLAELDTLLGCPEPDPPALAASIKTITKTLAGTSLGITAASSAAGATPPSGDGHRSAHARRTRSRASLPDEDGRGTEAIGEAGHGSSPPGRAGSADLRSPCPECRTTHPRHAACPTRPRSRGRQRKASGSVAGPSEAPSADSPPVLAPVAIRRRTSSVRLPPTEATAVEPKPATADLSSAAAHPTPSGPEESTPVPAVGRLEPISERPAPTNRRRAATIEPERSAPLLSPPPHLVHPTSPQLPTAVTPDMATPGLPAPVPDLGSPDHPLSPSPSALAIPPTTPSDDLSSPTLTSPGTSIARWTDMDRVLAVEGYRQHGRDFEAVARMVRTKTEDQCRNFYHNYRRKYGAEAFQNPPDWFSAARLQAAQARVAHLPPVAAQPAGETIHTRRASSLELVPGGRDDLGSLSSPSLSATRPSLTDSADLTANADSTTIMAQGHRAVRTDSVPDLSLSPVLDTAQAPEVELAAGVGAVVFRATEETTAELVGPVDDTVNPTTIPASPAPTPVSPAETSTVEPAADQEISVPVPITSPMVKEEVTLAPTIAVAQEASVVAPSRKPHYSSYWSVAEKAYFLTYLAQVGKHWDQIAALLKSKTAIQVRNYFQNNQERLNLNQIVEDRERTASEAPVTGAPAPAATAAAVVSPVMAGLASQPPPIPIAAAAVPTPTVAPKKRIYTKTHPRWSAGDTKGKISPIGVPAHVPALSDVDMADVRSAPIPHRPTSYDPAGSIVSLPSATRVTRIDALLNNPTDEEDAANWKASALMDWFATPAVTEPSSFTVPAAPPAGVSAQPVDLAPLSPLIPSPPPVASPPIRRLTVADLTSTHDHGQQAYSTPGHPHVVATSSPVPFPDPTAYARSAFTPNAGTTPPVGCGASGRPGTPNAYPHAGTHSAFHAVGSAPVYPPTGSFYPPEPSSTPVTSYVTPSYPTHTAVPGAYPPIGHFSPSAREGALPPQAPSQLAPANDTPVYNSMTQPSPLPSYPPPSPYGGGYPGPTHHRAESATHYSYPPAETRGTTYSASPHPTVAAPPPVTHSTSPYHETAYHPSRRLSSAASSGSYHASPSPAAEYGFVSHAHLPATRTHPHHPSTPVASEAYAGTYYQPSAAAYAVPPGSGGPPPLGRPSVTAHASGIHPHAHPHQYAPQPPHNHGYPPPSSGPNNYYPSN
ncbi:DNA-binding protein snt1 [Tieghemiomyces parasiticus]|uniref:DNA-binding protein snt1 n=1 Tax=Tieghemiomyces parasiticus TaxID=78921 RepID=A0A9W7ZRP0_9FUNG|nr:DNA-binding protein snt1 [Tieghemiomyces parasiticus]